MKETLLKNRSTENNLGENHKMAGKIKSKKDKKKTSKKTEENEKLALITNKLAENPDIVKMIQDENEEKAGKSPAEKNSKKKLLKIGIPIALVLLIAAGATLFILKSGMFFGKSAPSNSQENTVDMEKDYAQAQTYYTDGSYYDASVLFTLLGDYENSEEMLGKIDLETIYAGNGVKIAEYIGSDVINNYLCIHDNYNAINTALGATEETTEKPAEKATEETDKTAEDTEKSAAEAKKTEEKIVYDKAVIATVKEKTDEMITAGNRVKSLNLTSDNVLYAANEVLKKSADYNIQVAQKIQEGVDAGTYQPNGSNETTQEVKTLVENIGTENSNFIAQIETIISVNAIDIVGYSETGTCLNRYLESISK